MDVIICNYISWMEIHITIHTIYNNNFIFGNASANEERMTLREEILGQLEQSDTSKNLARLAAI